MRALGTILGICLLCVGYQPASPAMELDSREVAYIYQTSNGRILYQDQDEGATVIIVQQSPQYPGYYFYGPYWWGPGYYGSPYWYNSWSGGFYPGYYHGWRSYNRHHHRHHHHHHHHRHSSNKHKGGSHKSGKGGSSRR